jgi:hypothetical protein
MRDLAIFRPLASKAYALPSTTTRASQETLMQCSPRIERNRAATVGPGQSRGVPPQNQSISRLDIGSNGRRARSSACGAGM